MTLNTKPHIHEQVVCANMFVRKGDKLLVIKRSPLKKYAPNYAHPIGGKVDKNENPYVCAQRELLEEAGITVKNIKLEAVFLEIQPEKDEPYNWLIFHFSGDYDSGTVKQTDEGKLIWLSAKELGQEKLFPSIKPVLHHILDKESGTLFATYEYDPNHKVLSYSTDFCVA